MRLRRAIAGELAVATCIIAPVIVLLLSARWSQADAAGLLGGVGQLMGPVGKTAVVPPPPAGSFIVTEAANHLVTESSDPIVTEAVP